MHGVHALPVELWSQILDFLSEEDLKTMFLVHRSFRARADSIIWQSLTLCTLQPGSIDKTQAVLDNPDLARHVKRLCLRPINWDAADKVTPTTGFWIPTMERPRAPKRIKWSNPISSWRHHRQSLKSTQVLTKVTPLLTHIQEVIVTPNFQDPNLGIPPLEPYRSVWVGLRTENLQKLSLQLLTPGAIQVISKAMRSASPLVFVSLCTLILDLGIQRNVYPELQEDLQAILDCGRDYLRSLRIRSDLQETTWFALVIRAFGSFPKLVRFHLLSSFEPGDAHLEHYLLSFLLQHRRQLDEILLYMDNRDL
ncbi:hypothetical protein BDN72DRAFT_904090 [Pluteus cervinus]|uniref:Uncharacterized protein n=1 Tax=Pluteus cervinus TaxID=181527 RepID=A0ACD3A733_9AGAR|nr:hypothetical protein BDN72DRAFT_904090 [Pluteus cervinus]